MVAYAILMSRMSTLVETCYNVKVIIIELK